MITTYTIDDRKYKHTGYYGIQLESYEDFIKIGDTRVIMNRLFYASMLVKNIFAKNRVGWCMLDNSKESIDNFLRDLRNG